MGCGKDGSPMYLDLNIQFPGFVGPRDVEVLRYWAINLG